jgi:hypothetical protein
MGQNLWILPWRLQQFQHIVDLEAVLACGKCYGAGRDGTAFAGVPALEGSAARHRWDYRESNMKSF